MELNRSELHFDKGNASNVAYFGVRLILAVIIGISCQFMAHAQTVDASADLYEIVAPPVCKNYKSEEVHFVDGGKGSAKIAAGMATRDASGKPIVYRSYYTVTPPEFQKFIDLHECAHHQTGDVDLPHPTRNSPAHLMNESISDCVAILRLRDEQKLGPEDLDKVKAAMRVDMTKIGFPEISISSRISNIDSCYSRSGTSQEFVSGILKLRGLDQP